MNETSLSSMRREEAMEDEIGFVIKDRRRFDDSGQARPEAPREEQAARPREPKPEAKSGQSPRAEKSDHAAQAQHPAEISFAGFVLSLSTSALFHFGDIPDPATGKAEKNLPAAKQTIDLLAMLKDKTRNNLEKDEGTLLDGLLYELRLRYVQESEKK